MDETHNLVQGAVEAAAILNAVIAIVLSYGRIIFSSGRDRAWPGPVNGWMTLRSSRFRSPWFATAAIGVGEDG